MEQDKNEAAKAHLIVKSDYTTAFIELGIVYITLYVVMSLINTILVRSFDIKYFLLMFVILFALLFYAVKSAACKITFVEADEYRGARAIVEIGRKRYEVTGTTADEFSIRQAGFEKKRNTGRIYIKKYRLFLFGVSDIDKVREFLNLHFQRNAKSAKKRK